MSTFEIAHVDEELNDAKLRRCQRTVFIVSFINYTLIHYGRKSLTLVKPQLIDAGLSLRDLSMMDAAFLFTYAVGSLFSGYLADSFAPRGLLFFRCVFCVYLCVSMCVFMSLSCTPSHEPTGNTNAQLSYLLQPLCHKCMSRCPHYRHLIAVHH